MSKVVAHFFVEHNAKEFTRVLFEEGGRFIILMPSQAEADDFTKKLRGDGRDVDCIQIIGPEGHSLQRMKSYMTETLKSRHNSN